MVRMLQFRASVTVTAFVAAISVAASIGSASAQENPLSACWMWTRDGSGPDLSFCLAKNGDFDDEDRNGTNLGGKWSVLDEERLSFAFDIPARKIVCKFKLAHSNVNLELSECTDPNYSRIFTRYGDRDPNINPEYSTVKQFKATQRKVKNKDFIGCWSYRTKRVGVRYSATYCFGKLGRLYGIYTEGNSAADGTDFVRRWRIVDPDILHIIRKKYPPVTCKYNMSIDKNLIIVRDCTQRLNNGLYTKTEGSENWESKVSIDWKSIDNND